MTNHNPRHPESLKETILRKIDAHELSMRPRIYFILHVVALTVLALAILVISVFIFNFISFSVRLNSEDALLGFGPRGIVAFLTFFPWLLLIADVLLVVLLQGLLRRFRFGYRIPVLYLLGGLLLTTLLVGFVVDSGTGINEHLLHQNDQHRLPGFFGDFYGHARRSPPPGSGIYRATITNITDNTLTAVDSRSLATLTVLLPQDDPRATTTSLHVGDVVVIAGDMQDGVLHAFGLHKVSPEDMAHSFDIPPNSH